MTPPKDPYRTLGLARGATLAEVRAAYRALAKVNHPDVAGPAALPRFLAIKAAYEQVIRSGVARGPASRGAPAPADRPSSADPDRADATNRAYGGRARRTRTGARPERGRPSTAGSSAAGPAGRTSSGGPGTDDPGGGSRDGPGKATLGSTSYDGAEGQPFEPDWGGASWYGTTSGTYWTINPKEYADPRKHGPEYQARARRAARARAAAGAIGEADGDGDPGSPTAGSALGDVPEPEASAPPTDRASRPRASASPPGASAAPPGETPSSATGTPGRARHDSWAGGPAARAGGAGAVGAGVAGASVDAPPPDLAAAATDLGRALTDERTAHGRWRLVQAIAAWLPIAFGLVWLVGEITGCGRFAATCDPTEGVVGPILALVSLGVLALVPALASIAAMAAISLLVVAVPVALALSAGGAATAPETRTMVLGLALVVGWLAGLAFALVRRSRGFGGVDRGGPGGVGDGPGPEVPAGPVS